MNLPNSITAARIAASPLLAVLPFIPSVAWRAVAFVLYLVTAMSDRWDGQIARSRGLITDLGKVLDPLADKLLLLGTFVPMFLLQAHAEDPLLRLLPEVAERSAYPFVSWGVSAFWFPWWVLALILGREVFMTWFRTFAQRRGTVIAAQRLGKWKAGFQYTWMGSAYAWFVLKLLFDQQRWHGPLPTFVAQLLGAIGIVTMAVAFVLTLVSLGDYLVRHRAVFGAPPVR
ncbi:MAG: CDP-alcohol phosphatidyltransferase family protein [Gemmatimonadetes bacterium]|nr:CDP-alcohol phosphatidyltransferase family protein [Gemmatimonadota bacterium]